MSQSKVVLFDDADPDMQRAYEEARANFRYFWRELAWERRRIVPALDLACVKAPFSDGSSQKRKSKEHPDVEQMWCGEVDFDGENITGELLNEPNWLTSVHAGDRVWLTLGELTDWMYVISGKVYGAYTVNLMRSRMNPRERREHDEAWGLDFGDPATIRIDRGSPSGEHPMSENMASSLVEALKQNRSLLTDTDDGGWTLLHQEALAGSAPTVKVLLAAGADRQAKTADGKTALDLARSLGWESVVKLLKG